MELVVDVALVHGGCDGGGTTAFVQVKCEVIS